jgi:5-hydroxyisourate hydrolase
MPSAENMQSIDKFMFLKVKSALPCRGMARKSPIQGVYQQFLENISLWPWFVDRGGRAMLKSGCSELDAGQGKPASQGAKMGRLTTHVLDTAAGRPAAGLRIDLHRIAGSRQAGDLLVSLATNGDGRCERPLLEGAALQAGTYELVFHAGPYFAGQGVALANPPFLDEVVVRFGIADIAGHYHVPLLLSPYGYSTYRGS